MIIDFFLYTIFPFIFVLTLIIFVHELGHYLVARWNGVSVEVFSIGFGPRLFGFYDSHGTLWKLCAIPLGGYVKFLGDSDGASTPDRARLASMDSELLAVSFEHQALWRKSLIVVAGPVANFLLAIVIYTFLFGTLEEIRVAPVVNYTLEDSAAERAGFLSDDRIISVNGSPIESFEDIREHTLLNTDEELLFVVLRSGTEYTLRVRPTLVDQVDRFGNEFRVAQIGIAAYSDESHIERIRLSPFEAFSKAIYQTWFTVKLTLNFIYELFRGKQDTKELRGPVGIGQITSQFATLGFLQLLSLSAVLSISIGLLNLFPIPLLDGGHLLFYGITAILGRPLSDRFMGLCYRFGFFLLIGFMLYVTSNDIVRLFS